MEKYQSLTVEAERQIAGKEMQEQEVQDRKWSVYLRHQRKSKKSVPWVFSPEIYEKGEIIEK